MPGRMNQALSSQSGISEWPNISSGIQKGCFVFKADSWQNIAVLAAGQK